MKRRNYWLLFAILLLSLTSLSPSLDFTPRNERKDNDITLNPLALDSPNQVQNQSPIVISVHISEEQFKVLTELNKQFIEDTGIQVELSNVDADIAYAEALSSFAMGNGPDVLFIENEWVHTFATKGYLLPVESYLKNATGSNVLRTLLPTVEWNGYQWATPFDMDPYVFVWQPKTLNEMGLVEPPNTKKEWADLLIKQAEGNKQYLLGIEEAAPYAMATLLGGMDVDILQPDEDALLWLEQAIPFMYIVNKDNQEAWKLLQEGDLSLYLTTFSEAKSSWKEGLKVELPDDFYNNSPMYLRSRSFAVSSHTSLSEQSAEWIAYMTESTIQEQWFEKTARLPSLSMIYEDAKLSYKAEIPFRLDLLKVPSDETAQTGQVPSDSWNELHSYIDQMLAGQISVVEFKEKLTTKSIIEPLVIE
ncbi:extracellular solute-binding protein [Paenibacillus crassostreae]|uniref:ABC transporter substrate-binding protein n=1 Tax=Paenibacillus crassostreae TaxID=1763538 RepID=A0A167C3C0_9BACL|nr:extracellular solute-binding protein [Paenibacillus crassostreae]AOZ91697.1 hypothetical protein LPB68_05330 [Paenibacillus crassostreae]OAB72731.1 hypothetical protein PNBC_14920 [Paenibacillus crassostreae]